MGVDVVLLRSQVWEKTYWSVPVWFGSRLSASERGARGYGEQGDAMLLFVLPLSRQAEAEHLGTWDVVARGGGSMTSLPGCLGPFSASEGVSTD